MTVAVAVETRISHSVARVSAAPAAAPRSLSRQVRDSLAGNHLTYRRGRPVPDMPGHSAHQGE